LEDLQDGWEQSGQVGQEVYGAGNAFGILPRHYMHTPGNHFLIFTDYPTEKFNSKTERPARLKLAGDGRLSSRLMLVKAGLAKLPEITITVNGSEAKAQPAKNGALELIVPGDAAITIPLEKTFFE